MNHHPKPFSSAILNRPFASMLVLLLILLAGVMGAFVQGKRAALVREQATFDRSFDALQYLIQLEIGRSLSIPEVLEASKTVGALLLQPNAAAVAEQNEILEQTARNVRVDVIYVMDLAGNTLAASNWHEPDSFVGKNYAIRPYFRQAIAGDTGRYIAKGMTSLKVGYYISRPVRVDAAVRGVVVTKISLDAIQSQVEQLWRRDGEIAIVTDQHGVVAASPFNTTLHSMI
jgi:two-component system C4-dicarboxylate transport sensor histidine kinase DctB